MGQPADFYVGPLLHGPRTLSRNIIAQTRSESPGLTGPRGWVLGRRRPLGLLPGLVVGSEFRQVLKVRKRLRSGPLL